MKNIQLSERKKDLILLILTVFCSGLTVFIITLCGGNDSVPERFEKPFIYIWYAMAFYVTFVSYLESRDQDAFVEGRTQKLGVVNSFTTAVVVIALMSKGLVSWAVYAAVIFMAMFCARELGRVVRKKKQSAYLNQIGIMLTDLHNSGEAAVHGKSLKVWSEEDIPRNSKVQIIELKGNYLYVKRIK